MILVAVPVSVNHQAMFEVFIFVYTVSAEQQTGEQKSNEHESVLSSTGVLEG